MPQIRNIFLFLFLAAMVGCGGSYDRKLVDIDSLAMNGEAQRALALLDSVDAEGLSKSDRMYLELLKIKARDKAFIDHRSDSAVSEIVEYFENHDTEKQAEAYYYAGSVYRDMHDAPQAVAYFQKCIEALDSDYHSRMMSNAYYQCGELFRLQCLQPQAVEMYRESFRCDSVQKDTVRMIESLSAIAKSYGIIQKKGKFESVVLPHLRRALELSKAINNEYRIASITSDIAYMYSFLNKYDKVSELLPVIEDYLKKNPDSKGLTNLCFMTARWHVAQKQYDAALPYCEELIKCTHADYRRFAEQFLFKIYAAKGDFTRANQHLDRYEFMTDSMMVFMAQDATAQANSLYNYQLRERDNLTLKAESQERLYLVFILAAAALLIGGGFWVYRLRQKQKQQILNQQISRLRQFERLLKEQSESTATKQDLTRQRLFESEASEMLKQRIAKNRPLRDADIALLDETVNKICDGFKSTLYSAYNLSAQEYAVCLLLKFELSATDISHLVARSPSAISLLRKRLFHKLFGRDGDANDLDKYIRSL